MGSPRETVTITLGDGIVAFVNEEIELWIRDEHKREARIACNAATLKRRLKLIEQLSIHLPEGLY